jgi:hypothetical protein
VVRRSAWLAVAFFCAAGAAGQSRPATQPASRPAEETIAVARQRLAHIKSQDRTDYARGLLAALDFVVALESGDSRKIGTLVDAVGYQALPLAGELPEKPEKPLSPAAIDKIMAGLPKTDLGALPASSAEVVTRLKLVAEFPAVAVWMLPQDVAIVFRPVTGSAAPTWLSQSACVVVRIRGERATIIGGNLLEACFMAAENAAPEAEDK